MPGPSHNVTSGSRHDASSRKPAGTFRQATRRAKRGAARDPRARRERPTIGRRRRSARWLRTPHLLPARRTALSGPAPVMTRSQRTTPTLAPSINWMRGVAARPLRAAPSANRRGVPPAIGTAITRDCHFAERAGLHRCEFAERTRNARRDHHGPQPFRDAEFDQCDRGGIRASWMPAPVSASRSAWSNTATWMPCCASTSAAASPPIPRSRNCDPGFHLGPFWRGAYRPAMEAAQFEKDFNHSTTWD